MDRLVRCGVHQRLVILRNTTYDRAHIVHSLQSAACPLYYSRTGCVAYCTSRRRRCGTVLTERSSGNERSTAVVAVGITSL